MYFLLFAETWNLSSMIKFLFFLRIFDSLSYIVTLLQSVIYDLHIFMLFYPIFMYMFSLMIAELGLRKMVDNFDNTRLSIEYQFIGNFIQNMVMLES